MATHGIWEVHLLPFVFNYKHSDGGTGGGCSVVLVVSPLVSLIMEPSPRRHSCHTASRISSLVISPHNNLSIIGLVRGRFPESFAHAQTVDTRPLFPPPTWPGYEARLPLSLLMVTIDKQWLNMLELVA